MGYDLQWHDYPMEHSVCMEEIEHLGRWLVKVLAH
jgi:phospholipase/carboxylesterase